MRDDEYYGNEQQNGGWQSNTPGASNSNSGWRAGYGEVAPAFPSGGGEQPNYQDPNAVHWAPHEIYIPEHQGWTPRGYTPDVPSYQPQPVAPEYPDQSSSNIDASATLHRASYDSVSAPADSAYASVMPQINDASTAAPVYNYSAPDSAYGRVIPNLGILRTTFAPDGTNVAIERTSAQATTASQGSVEPTALPAPRSPMEDPRARGDLAFRVASNSFAAGVAAWSAEGWLASSASFGAKRLLAHSLGIGKAGETTFANLRQPDNSVGLKVGQWWESHHGMSDNNVFLTRAKAADSNMLQAINAIDDKRKAAAIEALETTSEKYAPEVRKLFTRVTPTVLTAEEESQLYLYSRLKGVRMPPGITSHNIDWKVPTEEGARAEFMTALEKSALRSWGKLSEGIARQALPEEQAAFGIWRNLLQNAARVPGMELSPNAQQQLLWQARDGFADRLKIMPRDQMAAHTEDLSRQLRSFADAARPDAEKVRARIRENPQVELSAAERGALEREFYLSRGGKNAYVDDQWLTPEEAKVKGRYDVFSQKPRMNEVADWQINNRLGLAERAQHILEKENGKEILDRWKMTGNSGLSSAEQGVLSRLRFFTEGKALPQGVELSSAEIAVIERAKALKEISGTVIGAETKAPVGWKGGMASFGKGLALGAGITVVEGGLDKMLFPNKGASWGSDSLTLPLSFCVPGPMWVKGATAIGTHLIGDVADAIAPPEHMNPTVRKFLQPNPTETALVTAAFFLPVRGEAAGLRMAYVAGAWGLSKASNLFFESGEEVQDKAFNFFKEDKTERSADSMQKAIEEFKKYGTMKTEGLGPRGESALDARASEWRYKQHDDRLNALRGSLILNTALGERKMDDGLYTGNGIGAPGDYIHGGGISGPKYLFSGKNLDLGGHSLALLMAAKGNVQMVKDETRSLLDSGKTEWRGTALREEEISDLDKIQTRIDNDIQSILGPHDIPALFDEARKHTDTLAQKHIYKDFLGQIEKYEKKDGINPRFIAKLYRDVALVRLAIAANKIDGGDLGGAYTVLYGSAGGQVTGNRDAEGALHDIKHSKDGDPYSADNAALEQIAVDLVAKLKAGQGRPSNFDILHTQRI